MQEPTYCKTEETKLFSSVFVFFAKRIIL
uniref:Uncharacterized protein n=1 Tax=Rhizophora mucronata TaxID=61149 RepID=A0A2P2QJW4_RHIMU